MPKKQRRVVAKAPFKTPYSLGNQPRPPAPEEDEALQNRVPEHFVRPGPVPNRLRHAAEAAGLTFKPELPDAFRHAVYRQGRPKADSLMRHTTQELVKKGVRFGTGGFDPAYEEPVDPDAEEKQLVIRPYTDVELRRAFNVFDLNSNDFIDAAELRHIFAQIGEMPSDNEISAMILLCDPRGDGTVNFDDFLNVFSNPADSLRNANIRGLKHLLPRKKLDFDIRDPLGFMLEEKWRLKECKLMVMDVRKGSQAQDAGVKSGWKVISLEGVPVTTEKDFENRIKKLEKSAAPEDGEEEGSFLQQMIAKNKAKGGKDKGKEEPVKKAVVKYDYTIVFEVLAGADDTSSSSEAEEEVEEDEEEDEEDEEAA